MRADDDSGCMDTREHTKEEKIYTFYLSDRPGVGIAARTQSAVGGPVGIRSPAYVHPFMS